jgi:hypothetical protein
MVRGLWFLWSNFRFCFAFCFVSLELWCKLDQGV